MKSDEQKRQDQGPVVPLSNGEESNRGAPPDGTVTQDPLRQKANRYNRQLLLPEIGVEGQRRLGESRVTIVGMGALGSCAAGTLVRAGVGKVVLIDRDLVELHNLQRQVLYTEEDLDRPKALAASEILKKVNTTVEIEAHAVDLNPSNAEELLKDSDVVLDGTDNLQTRFLVNDVCVKHRIPWI
ncbi:MAG TPA: HesA/MoeB/ThiF family protein, partial [Methanomicrobiales archaeon]|nr:HesA/MoeB/ThiF family protein [Methanomicrobiales archaeon]